MQAFGAETVLCTLHLHADFCVCGVQPVTLIKALFLPPSLTLSLFLSLPHPQGLKELYSFQLAHPDVDVRSLFRNQGSHYTSYIDRGLKMVAEEKRALDNGETPGGCTTLLYSVKALYSGYYVKPPPFITATHYM